MYIIYIVILSKQVFLRKITVTIVTSPHPLASQDTISPN